MNLLRILLLSLIWSASCLFAGSKQQAFLSYDFSTNDQLSDWVVEGPGSAKLVAGALILEPEFHSLLREKIDAGELSLENNQAEYEKWLRPAMEAAYGKKVVDETYVDRRDGKKPAFRGGHFNIWCKQPVYGDFAIEFDVRSLSPAPLHMIMFCAEGVNGESIFDESMPERFGLAAEIMHGPMRQYRISYFSGERGTANMRRAPGREMVATANDPLNLQGSVSRFRVERIGGTIRYIVDGEEVFACADEAPLEGGYWGFRLMACAKGQYDNIVVYKLDNKPAYKLHTAVSSKELDFSIRKLKASRNFDLKSTRDASKADILLRLVDGDKNDGYSASFKNDQLILEATSTRGLMFAAREVGEGLDSGKKLSELERSVHAHYPFRAIKFNLPYSSYRDGKHLAIHKETCRDLNYWARFLDMMVENKFNTLTLWSLEPYSYMVKLPDFPDACPWTDEEMADWQQFWKTLFAMARERGIDTFIINWNIFVTKEFGQHYGEGTETFSESKNFYGDGDTSPALEEYTRQLVTATINTYEDLTGIGLTLGERMGGMTSEMRRDWIDRTIITGLKNADRKARLIYRAPLSAELGSHGSTSVTTEQITREAIENMGLDEDVWIEFKFNWSHAHSSPKVSIVHGGMLTDTYWEPLSDKYKGVWTMRNEDFFVLRWAQPDFIREFIGYNSQPYIGGCIIGSECYIPAVDFFTKPAYRKWDYAFERQWLFYKVWGNLLYDSSTPDTFFEEALNEKFNRTDGEQLLKAWKMASMSANRFASFYQGTWDATIYSEGWTRVGGKFIDIDNFINKPVLDKSMISIPDFVSGTVKEGAHVTPLMLADETERDCREALNIISMIEQDDIPLELEIELTDIRAWCYHGLYFCSKLRAGVALQSFRSSQEAEDQAEAVNQLRRGLNFWKLLVEQVETYNVQTFPYQFDQEFSWRKHIEDAEKDIEIAKSN
ncbi:MAG: DUF1961 family protein [Puniceicoccaceae bacterium]